MNNVINLKCNDWLRTRRTLLLLGVALLLGFACSGCVNSPKTYFYALQGFGDKPAPTHIAIDNGHTYGVGPLFLPEALMQPGVVSQRSGQQVNLSLFNIWGGNLREGITRVMASNISELTGVDAVWPFPWDNRNRPTRQVRIVIEQFSGRLEGQVVLKAKWALTELNGEKTLLQKRVHFTAQAQGKGFGPYVSALNDLINQLSIDVVTAIGVLDSID